MVIVLKTSLGVLSSYLVANWAEVLILGQVMKHTVRTQTHMSHIGGSMSYKISNEVSSSLHFLLYLSFCLFEHSPFGKIAIYYFYIIVFAIVVSLNFNKAFFVSLQSFMNHL